MASGHRWIALVITAFPWPAHADGPLDDLTVGYSLMHIDGVVMGGRRLDPVFNRHNLEVQAGVGPFTLGFIAQRAERGPASDAGRPETGLMLTAGYGDIVSEWLRFDALVRVALTADTDGSQPLYAADTDLRVKLVAFDPDGWGPVDRAVFPSGYVGTIVNRFGRVQAIVGAGLWWEGFGAYVSGLYSINGVEDPMAPGARADEAFAALKNAFLSISGSYDLDLTRSLTAHFEVRRNVPLANAGHDLVGAFQLRYFFE